MDAKLITPEARDLIHQVKDFCESEQIVKVTISNEAEHTGAAELGKRLAAFGRDLEAKRVELKEPHLQAGRDVDSAFKGTIALVKERVKSLGSAISAYQKVLEDIRIEKQRKMDDAARKERERIEADAKRQRDKADAARQAAAEAAERARKATSERERKAAEAEARRKAQVAATAESKAETNEEIASTVVSPVVRPEETGKQEGVSTRKNWKGRLRKGPTSFIDFVNWVVKTESYELLQINEKNLKRKASMIEDKKQIPGIEFYNDESTTFKG